MIQKGMPVKPLSALVGLGLYCLLLKVMPFVVMAVSGLLVAAFLGLILWGVLTDTPSGPTRANWQSRDVDGRD